MSRRPRSRRPRSRRQNTDRPPAQGGAPPQGGQGPGQGQGQETQAPGGRPPRQGPRRPESGRREAGPQESDRGEPHRPKRSLGQNFLVDPEYRARIVEAARVGPGETVVEIGPGEGALTEGLARQVAESGGRLVLVELDDILAADLIRRFRGDPRVSVVHGDILDQPLAELVPADATRLKVVGNIPYNVTTPILFHLLERPRPSEILLMVQREVADRILSPPGGGEYGALSVGVQSVASIERVLQVPAGAFRPRPQVDSTVIRIVPDDPPRLTAEEEARLRAVVRAVFQWRRKQLGHILREHLDLRAGPGAEAPDVERLLDAAGVRADQRPEEVSPAGFVAMARAL